jgi:hypothetical protein
LQNRGIVIFGLFLIIAGVISLLSSLGLLAIGWGQVWPFFLILPGLLFEFSYFINGRKDPRLLVPGGILLTYGVLFYYCSTNGFSWMSKLWPLFLLGPAIGLFQLFLFGTHDKSLLVPVGILGGLSAVFLLSNFTAINAGSVLFPAILIILGLVIIINAHGSDRKRDSSMNKR